MKTSRNKIYIMSLAIFFGFALFLVLVGGADAIWSPAEVNPPGNNIPPPINAGLSPQVKIAPGGLGVDGVFMVAQPDPFDNDAILADPLIAAAKVMTVGTDESPAAGVDVLVKTSTVGQGIALLGSGSASQTYITINPTNDPGSTFQSNIGVTFGGSLMLWGATRSAAIPSSLSIRSTGEIGIGVDDPLTRFHVAGSIPFVLFDYATFLDDGLINHNMVPGWQFRPSDQNRWSGMTIVTQPFFLWTPASGGSDTTNVRTIPIKPGSTLDACGLKAKSDFIPIDSLNTYKASIFVRAEDNATKHYAGLVFFDGNKNPIPFDCGGGVSCGYFLSGKNQIPKNRWAKYEGYLISSGIGQGKTSACTVASKDGEDACIPSGTEYVKFEFTACNGRTVPVSSSYFAFPALEHADLGNGMILNNVWSDRIHADQYCNKDGSSCLWANDFLNL